MKMDEVDFLDALVSTPSPSGHEQKVAGICAQYLRQFPFEKVWIDAAGNAVATNYAHQKGDSPDLLLFGHMDTISDPLPYRRADGRIYGRGAVDAKSPLAALLTAGAECAGGTPLKIMVAGVVEEEITTSKGTRHLLTYAKPKMAINGEPSNTNGITIAYKGRLVLGCRTHGKALHAGMASENPIERTFEFYTRVRSAYPQRGKFDSVIINLTNIHAGSAEAINVVPENMDFVLDVRLPPSIKNAAVVRKFRKLAPQNVTLSVQESIAGVETDTNHALCRAMISSMRANNLAPRYVKKSGSADMNITSHAGIPTIAYGPGDSALDHTPNEVIDIADYKKAVAVLKGAIANLNGAF
ncbi:MAG: M20/M25/M40 family metallo-hydrolase [Candidatus Micrarchaeota archaeon]|nr:M20/M25/M40 family metallo-hydrolase [Candidatus Micrarchaeota archaeon]